MTTISGAPCFDALATVGPDALLDVASVTWQAVSPANLCAIQINNPPNNSNKLRGEHMQKYIEHIQEIVDNRGKLVLFLVLVAILVFIVVQQQRQRLGFNRDTLIFFIILAIATAFVYCILYGKCSNWANERNNLITLHRRCSYGLTPADAIMIGTLLPEDYIDGFDLIFEPPVFRFPLDHGLIHYQFPTEWFYYVATLVNQADPTELFSVELMIIRHTMLPPTLARALNISVNDNQLAQMICVIGSNKDQKLFQSRLATVAGTTGLLAFGSQPVLASVGNNVVVGNNVSDDVTDNNVFPMRWTVSDPSTNLGAQLQLKNPKPIFWHGNRGLDPSNTEGLGISSYYYSFVRLETDGVLNYNGRQVSVKGTGWMDHQMFSGLSPLGRIDNTLARSAFRLSSIFSSNKFAKNSGWDYIVLQLDNNVTYTFERTNHFVDLSWNNVKFDDVSVMDADGKQSSIKGATGVILERVKNPEDGGMYPCKWEVHDGGNTVYIVEAIVKPSFMKVVEGILYEGAALVRDKATNKLLGSGWIEGCGYGDNDYGVTNILKQLQIQDSFAK